MTAVAPITSDGSGSFRPSLSAPCGSVAELRAFIGEAIDLASAHATIAADYADLGDDRGLEYALRCFAASSKAALRTFAVLKATNIRRRA
jgi:hypothetical protein